MGMIPKSWTKAGRAELQAEKERLAHLDSTLVALAKLLAEHAHYWHHCQSRGLWEDMWWRRHVGIHEKSEAMLRKRYLGFGGRAFNASIRGCGAGDDPSHYDIDDALRDKFGADVKCDSEAGGLFVNTTEGRANEVLAEIQAMAPEGDFGVDIEDPFDEEVNINDITLDLPFGNWRSAEGFLKGRGIEVTVDLSDAPGPSELHLNKAQTYLQSAVRLMKPELSEDEVEGLARGVRDFVETASTKKRKRGKK